jgi:hypothetical protein
MVYNVFLIHFLFIIIHVTFYLDHFLLLLFYYQLEVLISGYQYLLSILYIGFLNDYGDVSIA